MEIASKYNPKTFSLGCERVKAKNFGITKSKGKFLFFIDSDMKLDKLVVEECVKKFQVNKKLGGIIIPERSFGSSFWVKVRDFERQFYAGTKVESARFFPMKLVSLVNITAYLIGEDALLAHKFVLFRKISPAASICWLLIAFKRRKS